MEYITLKTKRASKNIGVEFQNHTLQYYPMRTLGCVVIIFHNYVITALEYVVIILQNYAMWTFDYAVIIFQN